MFGGKLASTGEVRLRNSVRPRPAANRGCRHSELRILHGFLAGDCLRAPHSGSFSEHLIAACAFQIAVTVRSARHSIAFLPISGPAG